MFLQSDSVSTECPRRRTADLAAICAGPLALGLALAAAELRPNPPDAAVRFTIDLALGEWLAAVSAMPFLTRDDWAARTSRGRIVRWLWTWACITFLVHVECAFHFVHGWSHTRAFEATRKASGFGEGIYVNYAFAIAWAADVAYWQWRPDRYASRTRWIDRALHGFMFFIAFNATVVYETGPVRWAGVVGTLAIGALWAWGSVLRKRERRGSTPPLTQAIF